MNKFQPVPESRLIPWSRLVLVTGILIAVAQTRSSGPAVAWQTTTGMTTDAWRQDLHQLANHVRENHRNPYHTISETDFQQAVNGLDQRLPQLSDDAIVLEFARLLALVGDGHSRLTIPVNRANFGFQLHHSVDPEPASAVPRFHTMPVRFGIFREGVHVIAATQEYEHLIGLRVASIGSKSVDEAARLIGSYIAHDTSSALQFLATKFLAVPELLVQSGVTDEVHSTPVSVTGADESVNDLVLPSIPYAERPRWIHAHGGCDSPDQAAPYFSFESRGGALVVTIRQINDSPTEPIGSFSRRLDAELTKQNPGRVILDLRACHGGDQSLSRALVLPLIRWEGSSRPGRLFALVGPGTFSAAVNLCNRLEEWTQVTLVGAPLASGPSHYSSSDKEILDNSGLVVRVSSGYFVGWTGSEWRENLDIRLPVQPAIADYLAGIDTVLNTALSANMEFGPPEHLVTAYDAAGINAALLIWARYRTDPKTAHLQLELAGNELAYHLLDKGQPRYAAAVFLYNREFYPDFIDAYLGEATALGQMGEIKRAIAVLEEAGKKAPGDERISELSARLGQLVPGKEHP